MNEWKPIKTAPRDGTPILVFNGPNYSFGTEPNQVGVAIWRKQEVTEGRATWCAQDCRHGVTTYKPTHWMSLPALPE